MPLEDLIAYLKRLSPGPVPSDDRDTVTTLLARSWAEFSGSTNTSMASWKVTREDGPNDLEWNPPVLTFKVVRHGGTVLGSRRGEKQQWSVNVEKRTATPTTVGHVQLYERDRPFRTEEMAVIADKVCQAVQDDPNTASDFSKGVIEWEGNDRVTIFHGKLVPAAAYQQTTIGRRRRFRAILAQKMNAIGWKFAKVGRGLTFTRDHGSE
jgi:hypothetical protein